MGGLHPVVLLPRSRRGCCSGRPPTPGSSRLRYTTALVYQDENAGSRGRIFHSRTNGATASLNLPVSGKGKGRARPFKTRRRRFSASAFPGTPRNCGNRPKRGVFSQTGQAGLVKVPPSRRPDVPPFKTRGLSASPLTTV